MEDFPPKRFFERGGARPLFGHLSLYMPQHLRCVDLSVPDPGGTLGWGGGRPDLSLSPGPPFRCH